MSTYILLKDLPNVKAGAKYRSTESGDDYVCHDTSKSRSWDISYPKEYIENNPDWFAKEEEPEDGMPYELTKKIFDLWVLDFWGKSPKKYSETELRERERLAFDAGRMNEQVMFGKTPITAYYQFNTFEDYLKTIKP